MDYLKIYGINKKKKCFCAQYSGLSLWIFSNISKMVLFRKINSLKKNFGAINFGVKILRKMLLHRASNDMFV